MKIEKHEPCSVCGWRSSWPACSECGEPLGSELQDHEKHGDQWFSERRFRCDGCCIDFGVVFYKSEAPAWAEPRVLETIPVSEWLEELEEQDRRCRMCGAE